MPKRVLIIDDEKHVLFVLRHAVKKLPDLSEVLAVTDVQEALDAVNRGAFDLIITDLYMPMMNGTEFTEVVRERMPHVPVIWITAHGCQTFRREAEALCVYRCLDKPVSISEIRTTAQEALDSANGSG